MTLRHIPQSRDFINELVFTTSRSSGPGGQNVNKVNSKVTLKWDVAHSEVLSCEEREMVLKKLATRITRDGVLMITVQDSRSQLENKEASLVKLDQLLVKVLTPDKLRKPTKPTKAAKRARMKSKKHTSEKKQWRQKP